MRVDHEVIVAETAVGIWIDEPCHRLTYLGLI